MNVNSDDDRSGSRQRPKSSAHQMRGVNAYWRELSDAEIASGQHRELVGGMWQEVGRLQMEFLRDQGLAPEHTLLDIGCGALRGGVHFIEYLRPRQYFGFDINESLLNAGMKELGERGLHGRAPNLAHNGDFDLAVFGVNAFDYLVAQSVFTHLYMNQIIRCLASAAAVMNSQSRFYATFFEAPSSAYIDPIRHQPGNALTFFDRDVFHYSFSEMKIMAEAAGLRVDYVGDWGHPRSQKMLCFQTPARRMRAPA